MHIRVQAADFFKKEFPADTAKVVERTFLSQSFCLITTGDAPIEVFKIYRKSGTKGPKKEVTEWRTEHINFVVTKMQKQKILR